MSDEEKDFLESDLGELDDLAGFVDFSDLGDIESANNMDIFGDLGDLTDLGDIPDLSGNMDLSETMDLHVSDKEAATGDLSDVGDGGIPELSDMNLSDIGDGEIPELSDINLSDIGDGEIPDLSDPDLLVVGDGEIPELSDIDLSDIGDGEISELSDIDLSDVDGVVDILDEIPDVADAGISDSENGDMLDFSDMNLSEEDDDKTVAVSDIGMSDIESEDIPELSDIAFSEPDIIPNLDEIESAFDASEAAADIIPDVDPDYVDMDQTEMIDDINDPAVAMSDFSDIGMSNLGEIDGIPVLSDLDVDEAVQSGVSDLDLTDTMDMGMGDLLGLDEMADSTVGMEEPIMANTDANSDFTITEDGLLGDMEINFDDMSSVEPEPAVSSASSGGASNIDSMLDGLLDNLDMTGSLNDSGAAGADSSADMIDFGGEAYEDIGSGETDMLDASMLPQEEGKEKKPGFFKRVFGNIVTDEIAEAERQAAEQEAEEAEKKAEEAQKNAEAKAAAKEQKKAEKEAKAAAKKKEQEEKKAQKAAEKAEKKAQAEAEAAEIEVVGKLNKVGVSIIAVCTILFLVCEIAGTNFFNYSRIKKEASNYFQMGKYTEAYKSAIGTDMKDKDSEEYDKIRTVMRVQQSINAYQNYARVKYYPEALDALLRGLKRYDANIEHAVALEVDKDMMTCRKQILSILKTEFKMSESDAYAIISLDKPQYQNKVIKIGIKKANS